jgi:spermidine/putrescine-binding protein
LPDGTKPFNIQARWVGDNQDIQEESDGDLEANDAPFKKLKKRKRRAEGYQQVEEITQRDVAMANAYGGEPKPRLRNLPKGKRFATVQRSVDKRVTGSQQ